MDDRHTKPARVQLQLQLEISGGGGVKYASYREAAAAYIQNWLPDWQTRHYMLPPVFEYKFTEPYARGKDKQEWRRASGAVRKLEPDCEDRSMDVVYHAVSKYMSRNNLPGVVFNSFSMKHREGILKRYLSFANEPEWTDDYAHIECDLIILSPMLGFVAFEVKGTESTRGKTRQRNLRKASGEQKSSRLIEPFLNFLAATSGLGADQVPVHRVVAFPFQRSDAFQMCDQDETSGKVEKFLFQHDFENESLTKCQPSHKPQPSGLSTYLQCVAEQTTNADSQVLSKSPEFSTLMQTLITICAMRSTSTEAVLDAGCSSEAHAIAKIDLRIREQIWWEEKRKRAKAKHGEYNSEPRTNIIQCTCDSVAMQDKVNRVVFLTPEQHKVLNGPRIQLIVGPAGTGKSVLIMFKAAELIKLGEPVVIVATFRMADYYKLWRKGNGFSEDQCTILHKEELSVILERLQHEPAFNQIEHAFSRLTEALETNSLLSPTDECLAEVKRIVDALPRVRLCDDCTAQKMEIGKKSIFMDDTLFANFVDSVLRLLYLAFDNSSRQCLWIACDVLQCFYSFPDCDTQFFTTVAFATLLLGGLPTESGGTLSILRSVQRCSRHVFARWHDHCKLLMDNNDSLCVAKELYAGVFHGHQFVGPDVVQYKCNTREDALELISTTVASLVEDVTRPTDIVILCPTMPSIDMKKSIDNVKRSQRVDVCSIEEQLNGSNGVALGTYLEAVSLEWPIVFFVYNLAATTDMDFSLGISRARTKLVLVEFTCDP